MNTTFAKFVRLTCVTMALVTVLSIVPFTLAQTAHASAAVSEPMVLTAVDITSPDCQIHTTRTRGATSITSSTLCLPGTVMKTEQVPLSQARAHHWSYLALSSATRQQIEALIQMQQQALRARLAPTTGTQERKALSPNYTCGWNTSTSTSNTMNGDFVIAEVYYYLASDCSTIILKYSTSYLDGPYNNSLYWHLSIYNHWDTWGDFQQTVAPPYTYYRETYNAQKSAGQDFYQAYNYSWSTLDRNIWQIDLGNLS